MVDSLAYFEEDMDSEMGKNNHTQQIRTYLKPTKRPEICNR